MLPFSSATDANYSVHTLYTMYVHVKCSFCLL